MANPADKKNLRNDGVLPVSQSGNDTCDRVTDLASRIYLSLVVANSSRTLEHHASEAFDKAEAFWNFADARAKKTELEK